MKNTLNISAMSLLLSSTVLQVGCQSTEADTNSASATKKPYVAPAVLPLSDAENSENWVLNANVSDEFNGESLDTDKWYVQGTDGEFYIWKGRAPSQFAPHNAYLEEGKLIVRTQWEPDYDFIGTPPPKQEIRKYENVTTAGVVSQDTFLYGYMEVRVKIPDASMTGAFWGTGYQQELDVFELIGLVTKGNRKPESTFVTSIHDWRPGHAKKNKVWKHAHDMPNRTAEKFHTYGVEWLPDGLKMYLDGEFIHHAKQEDLGDNWVLNNPMELWFDSEVFPWHGVPTADQLPANFEIDYVRVWQKPTRNLVDPAFFGFEGPLLLNKQHKPEGRNKYSKFWYMSDDIAPYLMVSSFDDSMFATGRKSLKLDLSAPSNGKPFVAFSPSGSLNVPAGEYQINAKVWLPNHSDLPTLGFITESPWKVIGQSDLSSLPREQWVKVTVPLSRNADSNGNDRLRVVFEKNQTGAGYLYLDDIEVVAK